MKVYIVTDGYRSDYRIDAVFLDKEKADNYCRYRCEYGDVVEWDTYDDNYEMIPSKTIEYYQVILSSKGDLISCKNKVFNLHKCDFEESFYFNLDKKFVYSGIVDSEEEAIKIAKDKRIQYLAEHFGL